MKRRRPCRAPRGAALIMALLVVALVTVIAGSLIERQNLWLRQVDTRRDLAQVRLLAIAGVDWARAVLTDDARNSAYDHPGEPWATQVPPMPAEGGEISGGMTDEHARWNLNNLVRNGRQSPEDLAIFRNLLNLLQLSPDLAATLADWLDADDEVSPGGAEDAHYQAQNPPYRAANRELDDVDELLRVRGFDAAIVERLRPYVAALPGYNPVNINTADATVLSAVLHDFPSSEIQQIVAERKRVPYVDTGDFRKRLSTPDLANLPGTDRIDTRSRFFRATVYARFGNAEAALTALLDRQSGWPAVVWQKFE